MPDTPRRNRALKLLKSAFGTNRWISLTIKVQNDRVYCNWDSENFPNSDLETALNLVLGEFRKHLAKAESARTNSQPNPSHETPTGLPGGL